MKAFGTLCAVVLGIVIVGVLIIIGTYNSLVTGKNNVELKLADWHSTLQRRADLIPNLVETVKGYAAHEEAVFTAVTEARSKVGSINIAGAENDAAKLQELKAVEAQFTSAVSRLLVVAENYPDLKASEGFRDLQHQLEGTENRINVSRQNYNSAVMDYNVSVSTFPNLIIANAFNFTKAEPFAADEESKVVPRVTF